MSDDGRNAAVRTDSETELKCDDIHEDAQVEDVYNNNNNILYSTSKASGVGDTPDLISDETPPLAILQISSDSDLFLELGTNNTTSSDIPKRGEGTEMAESSPKVDFSAEIPISLECEASSSTQNSVPVPFSVTESESAALLCALPPLTTPTTETHKTVGSSTQQTETITSDANQNGEISHLVIQKEQGNSAHKSISMLSSSDTQTNPESIVGTHFPETLEQITKHVIKSENEVPSTENVREQGSSNTTQTAGESRAVSAPEVGRQADVDGSIRVESASHESIHINESYDAGELLSLELEECSQRTAHSSDYEDSADAWAPLEDAVADAKPKLTGSSSRPSSSRGKAALSSERKSRKVVKVKENNQPRNKRKQSNSATRKSSKSPIRILEVYDRNTPVEKKKSSSKPRKPTSPYQCKIFPIQKVDPGPRSSFRMNPKQCQILDKELSRGLETEKRALVQALTEFYSKDETNLASTSCPRGVDDDSIICNGSHRETYMSWVLKEKRRENMEESENTSGKPWNPLINVFRKNVFTQVSSKPSLTGKAEETCRNNAKNTNTTTMSDDFASKARSESGKRIRLGGDDGERVIYDIGRKMYQSLKSLQKAIHLSDFLCFRNNAPDSPLGESLSQPGFQQFMDSENEIEVLENIAALLGNAKDDVEAYLKSLEKANLVTGINSGLSKIGILNNNELNHDMAENESTEGEPVVENQQIVPFTCPSCQSHMDLEISNPEETNRIVKERVLPTVCTFLGEPGKIVLNTYFKSESKSMIQTILCEGHLYQVNFSAVDASGFAQGIMKSKTEYFGQPLPLTLDSLLCCIHHSASYINTRICCSETWTRSSKRYLLESIESYLGKQYKPSTDMNWLRLYLMERKLKRINVFAGVFRNLVEELLDAVTKLHFCMKKALMLLSKRLREPDMPGFCTESSCTLEESMKSGFSGTEIFEPHKDTLKEFPEMTASVEQLYETLKTEFVDSGNEHEADNVSVQTLLEILSRATKDIEVVTSLGKQYQSALKMPGKSSRRAFEHIIITLSQLGFSKEIHFEGLVATFLSCVDKLSLFEEFICGEKVDVRARLHTMCLKIIQKLHEIRTYLWTQRNWSIQLAKNSYTKVKEINEIKRIRKLKKSDKYVDEKIEFLGGSDGSLRASVF